MTRRPLPGSLAPDQDWPQPVLDQRGKSPALRGGLAFGAVKQTFGNAHREVAIVLTVARITCIGILLVIRIWLSALVNSGVSHCPKISVLHSSRAI